MTICSRCLHYGWHDPLEATLFSPDGEGYCILHAPHEMKKDMHDDVLKALEERIDNRTYDNGLDATLPSCDLSGIIIGGNFKISKKNLPTLVLKDVTFLGEVHIIDCIFEGSLKIDSSHFHGNCFFDRSNFKGPVEIANSTWHHYCSFSMVESELHAVFVNSIFEDRCAFRNSTWRCGILIQLCIFKKGVSFEHATFKADVDFTASNLGSDDGSFISLDGIETSDVSRMKFAGSKVNGIFSITNATLKGYTYFDYLHFSKQSDFSNSYLGYASFRNCTFAIKPLFNGSNLERSRLLGSPIESFNLMACVWPTSKGRCITFDSRKVNNEGYFEIASDSLLPPHKAAPQIRHLEDLYRRLKKTAQDEKDDQRASDFHYAEKELQRLLALQIAKKPESACDHNLSACNVHGRIHYAFEAAILWIYKLVSEYGEGPGRALLILLILALLPLMFIGIGDTVSSLNFEAFRLAAPGILNKWVYFSPMVKIPGPSEAGAGLRILLVFYHIAITLQAALFGFALRNRFKR